MTIIKITSCHNKDRNENTNHPEKHYGEKILEELLLLNLKSEESEPRNSDDAE